MSTKKISPIIVIPIGIAYSEITPRFRGKVCLHFGEPLIINKNLNLPINEFNTKLNEKMIEAENKALKILGR